MPVLLHALTAALAMGGDWTPLPAPSLCRAGPQVRMQPVLASGTHIDLSRADAAPPRPAPGEMFAYATFLQMAEDDARSKGARLEVQRFEGGALVRGEPAVVAAALALGAQLETAGRALGVDLVVTLTPSRAGTNETPLRFTRRVNSGEPTFFGTRETLAFVAGFSVQVAAESGQSEPVIGHANHGRGLHLTASRVAGGERVLVQGFFDVADVAEIGNFDPDTADLGVLQQPRVVWSQVEFQGVVGASDKLSVDVRGLEVSPPDWKIEIEARTTRDEAPEAGGGDSSGYAVFDLSFASSALHGVNERAESRLLGGKKALPSEMRPVSIPASSIASLVEAARGPSPRSGRAALYWSDRLLLVPRADAVAMSEARSLVRGLENSRLVETRVTAEFGGRSASFPTCSGASARFVSGSERPLLVECRLEVAPQIWMPAPVVETVFDGLVFEFEASSSALDVSLSTSSGPAAVEVTRESAQIGRLQTLTRMTAAGGARVEPGQTVEIQISGTPSGVASVRADRR